MKLWVVVILTGCLANSLALADDPPRLDPKKPADGKQQRPNAPAGEDKAKKSGENKPPAKPPDDEAAANRLARSDAYAMNDARLVTIVNDGALRLELMIETPSTFVGPRGEKVFRQTFDFATPFSEGLASVVANNQCGYIDKSGSWVLTPRFTAAEKPVSAILWGRPSGRWIPCGLSQCTMEMV